jgi:hypothetical protein
MNIRLVVFALIFLVFGFTARAQQDRTVRFVRYGVFGSAGVNVHTPQFFFPSPNFQGIISSFSSLPTFRFEPTTSFGWTAGGLVELPIADRFGLSLRASYSQIGARLVAYETFKGGFLSLNGQSVSFIDIRIEHSSDMRTLAHISIEPYLTYRPLDMLVLYAGAQFATPLNTSVRSIETILDANDFTIWSSNGTKVRSIYQGTFPTLNILNIGLSGGIGYEVPIDAEKQWICAFEMFYTGFLGSLANNIFVYGATVQTGFWSLGTLRAGVSLRYAPFAAGK